MSSSVSTASADDTSAQQEGALMRDCSKRHFCEQTFGGKCFNTYFKTYKISILVLI